MEKTQIGVPANAPARHRVGDGHRVECRLQRKYMRDRMGTGCVVHAVLNVYWAHQLAHIEPANPHQHHTGPPGSGRQAFHRRHTLPRAW